MATAITLHSDLGLQIISPTSAETYSLHIKTNDGNHKACAGGRLPFIGRGFSPALLCSRAYWAVSDDVWTQSA